MILIKLDLRNWKKNPTTATHDYRVVNNAEELKEFMEAMNEPGKPTIESAWNVGEQIDLSKLN